MKLYISFKKIFFNVYELWLWTKDNAYTAQVGTMNALFIDEADKAKQFKYFA